MDVLQLRSWIDRETQPHTITHAQSHAHTHTDTHIHTCANTPTKTSTTHNFFFNQHIAPAMSAMVSDVGNDGSLQQINAIVPLQIKSHTHTHTPTHAKTQTHSFAPHTLHLQCPPSVKQICKCCCTATHHCDGCQGNSMSTKQRTEKKQQKISHYT